MLEIPKEELLKILKVIQDDKKSCHYKIGYIEREIESFLTPELRNHSKESLTESIPLNGLSKLKGN